MDDKTKEQFRGIREAIQSGKAFQPMGMQAAKEKLEAHLNRSRDVMPDSVSEFKQTLVARACSYELADSIGNHIDSLRAELAELRAQVPELECYSKSHQGWRACGHPESCSNEKRYIYARPVPPAASPYANWNPAAHPADATITANFGTEPFAFPECADGVFTTDTTVTVPPAAVPTDVPRITGKDRPVNALRSITSENYLTATASNPSGQQPAVSDDVAKDVMDAVSILRKHNEWRRCNRTENWEPMPYSPAQLGGAIACVCDHTEHSLGMVTAIPADVFNDAARYQWLKTRSQFGNRVPHIEQYPYQRSIDKVEFPHFTIVGLDDAIDAAILAANKEKGNDPA